MIFYCFDVGLWFMVGVDCIFVFVSKGIDRLC